VGHTKYYTGDLGLRICTSYVPRGTFISIRYIL